jgi:hypothetical protein
MVMILARLSTLLLAAVTTALAQDIQYDAAHNTTSITGMWSSGSQRVLTGTVSVTIAMQNN